LGVRTVIEYEYEYRFAEYEYGGGIRQPASQIDII
jgi:hypothetical protein